MSPDPASLRRQAVPIGWPGATLAVLAFAAWHIVVATHADLNPDEAYYWLWSRHPALAYFDHPPMVAWWIRLGAWLFGETTLGIRVATIVSIVATSAVVYATGRVLFDEAIARRALLWFNATLLAAVAGLFATPDAPSAFFWALAILAFALVIRTADGRWWLAVGFFAGLGILSKYNDLFLGLGLILALAVDRDLRRWLFNAWTWAGGLVALLVFSPVLLWNAAHHWASFAKQFGRITAGGFDPKFLGDLVGGQIALLNPFVASFVGLAGLIAFRRRPGRYAREIGILLATTAPLIGYMVIHATHARVDGNWLAPVYPTLALVAASAAEGTGRDLRGRAARFLRNAVVPFAAAASLLGLGYLAFPPAKALLPTDPAQAFRGWPAFAAEADTLRRKIGADWIATNDYNLAAELTFHLLGKGVPVEEVRERIRYLFAPPPEPDLNARPALLLIRGDIADGTDYAACFAGFEPVGMLIRAGIAGKPVWTIGAYRASGPRADIFTAGCDGPP